jgi:hypothetical protein
MISHDWGTTSSERALPFPCDALIPNPDDVLFRGVTIAAPAERIFRWLCQLRAAPYSYDWLDNGGRRSPREPTPGLENLAVGQSVMRIFTLAAFEPDRHLTIRVKPSTSASPTFGDVAATYLILPVPDGTCRLLAKLLVVYPRGVSGALMRRLLPWGDLIMMRRQLLNLKQLAEEEFARCR